MRDMRDELVLDHLKFLGFDEASIQFTEHDIVFRNFHSDVVTSQLKQEGAPIPGKNDTYYHNYTYPSGLVPGFEQIKVHKFTSGPYYSAYEPQNTRIQSLSIPFKALPTAFLERDRGGQIGYDVFIANFNLMHGTSHTVQSLNGQMVLTVDYTGGPGGSRTGEDLLKALIGELKPRVADKYDAKGPNYVSQLGRLTHILNLSAEDQAVNRLLGRQNEGTDLLALRDVMDGSRQPTPLRINKRIFHRWLDKLAREEGLLSEKVVQNLNMNAKNWVAVDVRQLRNYSERNPKLQAALAGKDRPNNPPLYISTTNGQHAFAMMVDFRTKTVFVANPLGTYENFQEIIDQVKRISGCDKEIHVITNPITREGDIPFQDVCTADSVALAHMLELQQQAGTLKRGSMNHEKLKTAAYVTQQPQLDKRDFLPRQHVSHRFYGSSSAGGGHQTKLARKKLEDQLKEILSSLSHGDMTADEAWEQAVAVLEQQKNYVSTSDMRGHRSIEYTADTGDRVIKKTVSETAQINLDRLYAAKLQAEESQRCYRPR